MGPYPHIIYKLALEIQQCRFCDNKLPLGANPVLRVGERLSPILIGY